MTTELAAPGRARTEGVLALRGVTRRFGSGLIQSVRPAASATRPNAAACGSRPLVRASPSTITVERGSRSSEISSKNSSHTRP